jgi:riboflavin biosynthesis pyrimidine reductase
MSGLAPLESLFDASRGREVPLPQELCALYGPLRFPEHPARPHVVGNFVTTLDGVVSLGIPSKAGGREISGANPHDRMVMGLLRAVADVVIVGAGTFRASSGRRWTPDAAYSDLAGAYRALRANLGKPASPLNVVVTAGGELDLDRPGGETGDPPLLVVTTDDGERALRGRGLPSGVEVVACEIRPTVRQVLDVVKLVRPADLILVEAGPRLMGEFVAAGALDELFLTVAPQIAGRDGGERPGLVAGQTFAPDDPCWTTLIGVKRAGSHLFTRYTLRRDASRSG